MPSQSSSNNPDYSTLPKRTWQGIFAALGIANYRKYWLGLMISNLGGQMQQTAQAWLAYELTNSPLKLTLVLAIQSIPMVIFSLFSGVLIDRIQKRNVIAVTSGISTILALVIAVLIATGNIQYWHLLVCSFISGVSNVFNLTARNAIIAELVPREKIYNAVALNNLGANSACVAGPAIAGVLIAAVSTQGAYYFGVGFCIIGIFIICLLPATSKIGQVTAASVRENLSAGLQYLSTSKAIILLLVMELVITLLGIGYSGLIPVFAKNLNMQSEGYGFMLSAAGIGSMIGSLAIASLGNFKSKGRILLLAGGLLGIVLVLFANSAGLGSLLHLGSGDYYLALVFLFGSGMCATGYTTTSNTIVQMNVSNEFRGRMNSFYSLVMGFYPLSTLTLGALAEGLGAPWALTITASALVLFMLIVAVVSRRMRNLE